MDIPEMRIRITVPNISHIGSYYSPEFIVRGLPWRIQFFQNKGAALGVYLRCENEDDSADWSCMAYCKFKLISFNQHAYERSFKEPREFNASQRSYGYLKFILINDLFEPTKNYVKNDSIVFEVKVTANASINIRERLANYKEYSDELKKCFRINIAKISDLVGFNSPEIMVRGLPWRIKIYTSKILYTKVLAISLNCLSNCNSVQWSCKARVVFRLLSSNTNDAQHVWMSKNAFKFTSNSKAHVCNRFISWKDLMDVNNNYVKNDSIVVEVELHVEKPEGNSCESEVEQAMKCPICLQCMVGRPISSTKCGHLFCKQCIETAIQNRNICPVCNQLISPDEVHPVYLPS